MNEFQQALRIAWRESRSSAGKFLFVVLAVAIGVGALTGVRGFSQAFRGMLLRDARTLMAGDLSLRVFHQPRPDQLAVLATLGARGVEHTEITETVSMMASPASSRPVLVAVKAVEPGRYPFYGAIELDPPGDLVAVLTEDAIVGSDDLFLRLGVEVGDTVRLGDADFRIAAAVRLEPDRMTGSFNVGPRVMLSRDGLQRAGLIQLGSRAAERYLFRLPERGISIAEARKILEEGFDEGRVSDFREIHPTIRRGLERATRFLSLVSLIALIVGSLGVGMAMHSHLQNRLDTIAIMKCLGARSGQVMRVYAVQTLGLGLAGSALGVLVGYAVQAWAPNLIARYFPVRPDFTWEFSTAVQGIAIGVLTTLLFTIPPLLGIRQVRPALIFRRDMEESRQTIRERLRASRAGLWAGAAIVSSIGAVAAWLGDSLEMGLWFAGGLLVSLLAMAGVSWILLRGLKALPKMLPRTLPAPLRHGIANLYRPGIHAEAVLVALGIGVTFTLSVYLIQSSVLTQMVRSAPPEMPNVFFINITGAEREGLLEILRRQPGLGEQIELVPSVAARLTTVDGVSVEDLGVERDGWRFRSTRTITWQAEKPEHIDVLDGAWWSPQAAETQSLVSVRDEDAGLLGLKIGSRVAWQVGAREVLATVAAIHRSEGFRMGSNVQFVLTPMALRGMPAIFYGGVKVPPEQAPELQKLIFERFPTITVINAADVIEIVQEVVDQIGMVVRFVSAFAILAGVVILVSSVVATRFRRIHEVVILKTLGATRRRVAGIFSVEFLILGLVAGLIGSVLASSFSNLLLTRVLDAEFVFEPLPNLLTIVGTALLANAAGWLASFPILGKKPLEVLRAE
jgi:putative ABC transport system permease protein